MATDATGTPTAKGIPKIDPANDAPSGLGTNAAMDAIDALFDKTQYVPSGSPTTNQVPIWNGSTWVYGDILVETIVNAKGDLLVADAADSIDRLAVGANGTVLMADSAQATGVKWGDVVIDRETAEVDAVSSTSEFILFTHAVAAGSMGTNKMLRLTIFGDYLHNNVAANTLALRVRWGGSVVYEETSNLGNVVGASRVPWEVVLKLANLGVANSQFLAVTAMAGRSDNTAPTTGVGHLLDAHNVAANSKIFGEGGTTGPVAVDTASAQTLEVAVQWNTSSANNSWKKRYAVLEMI